ncbi:hypothetical protein AAEP93_009129 [Penicillium crustosum]
MALQHLHCSFLRRFCRLWCCAHYPTLPTLIVGRAIAGLGCASLLVGAFSLVPFIALPAKRPIMIGLISASRGLSTTFGLLIGEALTERVSWRWNVYIELPLGVAIQVAFVFFCFRSPTEA